MTKITFIEHDGTEHVVEASNGATVMEAAVSNNIPGIDADCGGACACATCHVYVDEAFMPKVGKPNDMEQSMLDFAEDVRDSSRLCCQISISKDLEGLKVSMPEHQG